MIKAVFFDIDGTLVSFETHKIPQSTVDAITELKKKDIKVFIATGRAFGQIDNLGNIQFDGYITLNGSYTLNEKLEPIHKNPIPQEDIKALVDLQLNTKLFPSVFVTQDDLFICNKNDEVEEIERLANVIYHPVKEITHALDKEILQIVAFFDENEEIRIMKDILPNCTSTRWNTLFTDIIAKGNSKQSGIDRMLAYHNISLEETMSFGDGGNDIPMLQHTPISVAMGNASDEVKKHATHITDSVDNDGIWKALKELNVI